MKCSKLFLVTLTLCFVTSSFAQQGSGLAAFINGFMSGQQKAEESNLRKAETERIKAETDRLRVQPISAPVKQLSPEAQWEVVVGEFMTRVKVMDGIDYRGDLAKRGELDALVKYYGEDAYKRGMSDDNLKASRWALEQAHGVMLSRYKQ